MSVTSVQAVGGATATAVSRRAALASLLAFLALSAGLLAWAKWFPYLHKLHVTNATGVYPGHDVLVKAGKAGEAPSLARAFAFTKAYGGAIWPALVAALLIAASIEALMPRHWMLAVLGHRELRGLCCGRWPRELPLR